MIREEYFPSAAPDERAFPSPHPDGRLGMTLRDYFAAQALAHAVRNADTHFENAARIAYELADAMLKERERVK